MDTAGDGRERLPALFTYREAIEAGLSKRRLYAFRDAGLVEPVARGIFRRTDSGQSFDLDLAEISLRLPSATLCLTSALVRHDLTDQNPVAIDLAIPAGSHRPVFAFPVKLRLFDRKTFDIGRNTLPVGIGLSIGIFCAERCIVDAFRLSWSEGDDLAYIALSRWLRRRESKPASLYEMAKNFPNSLTKILKAVQTLSYE
jgi:predicted transcriptional regulator of viral defense system